MSTLANEFVITCEHASNALPPGLDLGLGAALLASHVAWDHGAREAAIHLAARLKAPVHLGIFSRLFVDLNRSPDNPDAVPDVAFGVAVPGNAALSPAAKRARVHEFHAPFWQRTRDDVERTLNEHGRCILLSVHSFTPVYAGKAREVEVGILFDPARPTEAAIADEMIKALKIGGIVARANEPYAGTDDGHAMALRRVGDSYAGIEIEISHVLTEAGRAVEVVDIVANALDVGMRGIARDNK